MATLSLARWIPGAASPPAWAAIHALAGLPPPDRDAVLLLAARLASPAPDDEAARYGRLLNRAERERLDRFRVDLARRRFLVGRGLLRGVLGHCLGCRPGEVPLTKGAHGKPTLAPGRAADPVRFNLSHSGEWILLAFTRRGEVGVDVEQVRPRAMAATIRRRQFHPDEQAVASGETEFCRGWALKEAVVKAMGRGLGYPTATFSVAPLLRGAREQVLRVDGRAWRCSELTVGDGYCAALAVEEPP